MRVAPAGAVERGEDRLLDAGFADRAGAADNHRLRLNPRARRFAQRLQRGEAVFHQNMRASPVRLWGALHQRRRGTTLEGPLDEAVAIHRLAAHGDEEVPLGNLARIRGYA